MLLTLALIHPALSHDPAPVWPDHAQGPVLAVDLHTHSAFSDGWVWPNIRTQEAEREGLAALAITEHLENQPHIGDIPHPDRNRAYAIALEAASGSTWVISGAEISRDMPPGHVNAVFLSDANALMVRSPEKAIAVANDQGAFVFWNHPAWPRQRPDGVARLEPMHERLIDKGQLHGIEVANFTGFSEEALQLALDHGLTILGNSDVHGLSTWDYDIPNGGHRTQTLVLAAERSPESLQTGLTEGNTVAWYRDLLIGTPDNVETLLNACLELEVRGWNPGTEIAYTTLRNACPQTLQVENISPRRFYNQGDVFELPASGEADLRVRMDGERSTLELELRVNSAYVGVREHPTVKVDAPLPPRPQGTPEHMAE